MTDIAGPICETTFAVPDGHEDALDAWLDTRVRHAPRPRGVADVRIWELPTDDGSAARICQFRLSEGSRVEDLLDGWLVDIEAEAADTFGDAITVTSRCLREDQARDALQSGAVECLNCGARLSGQYCGQCGQRSRTRLISLWELVADAFGDLFELDSRLWRTIIPLLVRPGKLTHDYLMGRRARYMPPFRSYLVLSLIFFVVAFFDPREDLGLLFEPPPEPTAEEAAARQAQADKAKQEILDDLAQSGILLDGAAPGESAAETDTPNDDTAEGEDDSPQVQFSMGDEIIDDDCRITEDSVKDLPDWLKRRLTPERLQEVCKRIAADKGKTFTGLFLDNIPVALIVLLPLMALVLKILYPLSRRYFVEHLLFFVHFHAFFFLALTLQILFGRLASLLHLPEFLTGIAIVAASFYIPVYLFMAMRRVYGQSRLLTFVKYLALVAAYVLGMSLTMFGAVLLALVAV